ncbi:MAG: pilus assembly protein PilM [Burkholderiales bacterium]|nr:pilus assembly protein PilM [Burkholderiales bacterium]
MAASELTHIRLRVRMREYARRLGVAGFWAWWTQELDAIVPAAPRAALARRRMRPTIVFAGDHATLWRPGMDGAMPVMTQAATVPLTADAAAVAAAGRAALAPLARIAYGGPAGPTRVVISLPAADVLRKKVVLPAAVEENLRQALAYDLDRHTPFKSDELYFDAVIVDRDTGRNTVTADLAAVRRAIVDSALRHVAAWGSDVAAVVPEPPASAARSRLNLLPDEARASKSVWGRWQLWMPLLLLAVMALAAVTIPLWQKRDYVLQLAALADQARGRAAVSETLRTELNARVGDYNHALQRKHAFPDALTVIDAVSKLMPDDTWLTQFDLKSVVKGKEAQRELLVRGETANAGRLVPLFEESQLFAQAAQRGPTTKIQPGPGEIFDLGAQLKPSVLPEPLALAVADMTASVPSAPSSPAPGVATPPSATAPPPPAAASMPAPAAAPMPPADGPPRKP